MSIYLQSVPESKTSLSKHHSLSLNQTPTRTLSVVCKTSAIRRDAGCGQHVPDLRGRRMAINLWKLSLSALLYCRCRVSFRRPCRGYQDAYTGSWCGQWCCHWCWIAI